MLVNFLYMEVLLFSNKKVPYKACKVSKPTSYKNAQHQNQLRCWPTEAPVLLVSINVFDTGYLEFLLNLYSLLLSSKSLWQVCLTWLTVDKSDMVDSHVADVGGLQTPLDIHRDGEGLLVMPTDGDGVVLQTIRSGYTNTNACIL